jgi:hypothetical protein
MYKINIIDRDPSKLSRVIPELEVMTWEGLDGKRLEFRNTFRPWDVDDKRPGNSRQQIKYVISTFKKALASSTSIYRRVDCQMPSNDSYHEAAECRLDGETSCEAIFTNRSLKSTASAKPSYDPRSTNPSSTLPIRHLFPQERFLVS